MGSKETSELRAQTINPQNTTKEAKPLPATDMSLECAGLLPPQSFPSRQNEGTAQDPPALPSC